MLICLAFYFVDKNETKAKHILQPNEKPVKFKKSKAMINEIKVSWSLTDVKFEVLYYVKEVNDKNIVKVVLKSKFF